MTARTVLTGLAFAIIVAAVAGRAAGQAIAFKMMHPDY